MSTRTIAAPATLPQPGAVLELLKPVTWFPPMWAYGCGLVSSGQLLRGHWLVALGGIVLAGPLVCAASQAVNDWYDRHVDAINEPGRPIPSGRMPGRSGFVVACAWSALSLLTGAALGRTVLLATAVALALAWAYSAPPIRLKGNGWLGNAACGLCYEGLAWVTGASVMLGGGVPPSASLALALLYSAGAHGIMTLNDFKSVAGDRQSGVRSIPVMLGPRRAAWLACAIMVASQLAAAALLVLWHRPVHAAAVGGLVAVQLALMARFLRAPARRALWYSGLGVPFFVLGMLAGALALRGLAQ